MPIQSVFRGSRANRDRRDASVDRFMASAVSITVQIPKQDIQVCPDCLGKREIVRQVANGVDAVADCLECGGTGWVN